LQNSGNVPSILDPSKVDITPRLLDRVSDKLCRASLTLGADDRRLFLLAGFVNDEGGPLGFLLCDLLRLNRSCEFGGEGKVLPG